MVSGEWKVRLLILCMTFGVLLCDADGRGTRGRGGRRGGEEEGGVAVVGGRSRSDRLLIEKIISSKSPRLAHLCILHRRHENVVQNLVLDRPESLGRPSSLRVKRGINQSLPSNHSQTTLAMKENDPLRAISDTHASFTAGLGDPCTAKCASKMDMKRRSCETRCRAHKASRLHSILSKIETLSTNSSESNITSTVGAGNATAVGNATAPVAVVARPRRVGCESTMEAAAVCALCPVHDDEDIDDTALEIPLPDGLPYLEGTDKERREFGEFLLSPALGLSQEKKQGDGEGGALYATSRMGAGSLCVAIAKAPNMTSSLSAIGIPVSSNKVRFDDFPVHLLEVYIG